MQFTGFRLVTLFTLAAVIVAIPTDPESVVPEMEDLQLPGDASPSTPGHYTITKDGSYEVTNNNYANDTPAPFPDTQPAPGSMGMAIGIDRNDVSRAKLPIFHWTWKKFMNSVNDMNGGDPSGAGHEFEVWVDGEIRMVPDQMYMSGPSSTCESASSAKVTVVSSSSEMDQYEDSSFNGGYDREIDVGVSGEVPGTGVGVEASTTLQTKMMIGSSESSQEYKAAADSGSDMSAFATITSWNYDVFVKDITSMSSDFTAEIAKLVVDSSDASMRKFFSLFGTDYLYAAKLGGKVTQQTSAREDTSSSSQKADLAESSSASFGYNFMKLDTSSSSAQSDSVANGKTKGFTTHKARFEGGEPSEDWMEWCESTAKKPSLVSFETRSVSSLVAQTDPVLAAKLEEFLVGRLERIEECQGSNSGMQYDIEAGECIVGECAAGSYQVSCGQSSEGTNTVESNVDGVGGWGGTCTCPDGQEYQVGDNNDSCSSLACINGVSGACSAVNPGGANVRVTCRDTACSNSQAGNACHVCEAGKFQPLNEERCDDCPAGTYADETGTAMNCKSCPDGKTSDTGSASCDHLTGAYWITTEDNCSLRPADSSGRGDGDLPDDSGKWAVFDCNNGRNTIQIEHRGGNEYQLKSGTHYLGDADSEGGSGTGDGSTCGGGDSTWGYFGTRTKKVTLEEGSYGTFKIKSTHNSYTLGKCSSGDGDKESNTAWAEFGMGWQTFLKFTPAN